MILHSEEFKNVCKIVLAAASEADIASNRDVLELVAIGNKLYLNVTNKEYYASVVFDLPQEEQFRATVNAGMFLKLIAAITTEEIELTLKNSYINVKANGNYKIPLIFENDELLQLPPITIQNVTLETDLSNNILASIANYNAKQLNTGIITNVIQKMAYLDQEGCITFNGTSACVNNFTLPTPMRVLLSGRLINLFKLFKTDSVHFTLGYDAISETIIQTKVVFENNQIRLAAILNCDDKLLNQVPVAAIRGRANQPVHNIAVLNTSALMEALDRIAILSSTSSKNALNTKGTFIFNSDGLTLTDASRENEEKLYYQNGTALSSKYYEMTLNTAEMKKLLERSAEQYVTLNFGDHRACVVVRNNIKNILSEAVNNGPQD